MTLDNYQPLLLNKQIEKKNSVCEAATTTTSDETSKQKKKKKKKEIPVVTLSIASLIKNK